MRRLVLIIIALFYSTFAVAQFVPIANETGAQFRTDANSRLQAVTTGTLNVLDYGAKCDGVTDDTTAFQATINASNLAPANISHERPVVIPWSSKPCIISQLNLTNLAGIHITGQERAGGLSGIIKCREASPDSGVCLDFSGSWYITVEGINFIADRTNPPKVMMLFAKTAGTLPGNSQQIQLRNNVISNHSGDYTIYNYGAEVLRASGNLFDGGKLATIVLTASNTAAVTSPFATLVSSPSSMTATQWRDNTYSCAASVNTGSCVLLDAAVSLAEIDIDGGYIAQSTKGFIDVTGAGMVRNLNVSNLRDEPQGGNTTQYFLKSASQIQNFTILNDNFANTVRPTVVPIQFNKTGEVSAVGGIINFRPGDTQATYPTVSIISCAMNVAGVTFFSADASGGGPLPSTCPGLLTAYQGGVRDLKQYRGSGADAIPACGAATKNASLWVGDGVKNCTYGSAYAAAAGAAKCRVGCGGSGSWLYGY
jgi:hypothetical protein